MIPPPVPPAAAVPADYLGHYQRDAEAIVDPAALDPISHAAERRRVQTLVRLLAPRPGEQLLDMGCGSGWLAAECARAGARVCAADVSWQGVTAVRQRYAELTRLTVADGYHVPLGTAVVDGAVLSEVLEHLAAPEQALAELARILRPGGRLLVCVPYRERILWHLCIHCNQLTPANAHLRSYDARDLHRCLEGAGLRPGAPVFLHHKGLALLSFARLSRGWPYLGWRLVDRLANALVHRPAYVAMVGVR